MEFQLDDVVLADVEQLLAVDDALELDEALVLAVAVDDDALDGAVVALGDDEKSGKKAPNWMLTFQ